MDRKFLDGFVTIKNNYMDIAGLFGFELPNDEVTKKIIDLNVDYEIGGDEVNLRLYFDRRSKEAVADMAALCTNWLCDSLIHYADKEIPNLTHFETLGFYFVEFKLHFILV